MHPAWIEIDLGAIRKNVRYLKRGLRPGVRFMGVVKADAYGHGSIPVARVLEQEGVDRFAVAFPEEGVELRNAGFQEPILILGTVFREDYSVILKYGLTPAVYTVEQAQELNDYAAERDAVVTIHIKVDTGMGRLGFLSEDPETVENIRKITEMANLNVEGLFSHFATSPQISDTTYCRMQFDRFERLSEKLREAGIRIPVRHIANSGATILSALDVPGANDLYPETQLDMVRPGTSIYGLYADEELVGVQKEIYPAMEIKASLAYVKPVPAGTRVSYTGSFETKRDSVLGIVPLGYVDGVFRNLANRGTVLLHGQRCPMVGNVCMDQFVIDITDVENPKKGDEVVLIGRQGQEFISAEEVGSLAGTISIEVLCGLGKRLPRYFRDKD